ncbi:DUF2510 domain-containing protein [Phycicoccus sp.]|uniref:DUF2510 domain-containing protein n=1 Tax=Phycicoccus sp. TaxID=1902410 RepID=UPI002BAEADF2|nr:DUF2510 domain-containing protein [Phycicoccus sp.]HMM93805.1 DUF2510 domain-containing protein [Phycicoccus sp.]
MAEVRHSRSHAIAGLTMGLGAGIVMLGTLLPVFSVSGDPVPDGIWGPLGLHARAGTVGFDAPFRSYITITGAWVLLMGVALIITRIRYVGPVWRVAALVGLASTSFITFVLWVLVLRPLDVLGRPTWFTDSAPVVVDALHGSTLDAGLGLYVLTVGCTVGVLAALVPAFHTRRIVKDMGGSSRNGLAPGWYPAPHSRRRTRYWDGEKWTVGA